MSGGEASAIYERIVTEDGRKLNEDLVGAYLDNVWLSGLTPMIMTDYESNLRIFATLLSKPGVEASKADLRAFVAYLKDKGRPPEDHRPVLQCYLQFLRLLCLYQIVRAGAWRLQ